MKGFRKLKGISLKGFELPCNELHQEHFFSMKVLTYQYRDYEQPRYPAVLKHQAGGETFKKFFFEAIKLMICSFTVRPTVDPQK